MAYNDYRIIGYDYEISVDCAYCNDDLWLAAEADVEIDEAGAAVPTLYAADQQPNAVKVDDCYAHRACAEKQRILDAELLAMTGAPDRHARFVAAQRSVAAAFGAQA